MLDVKRQNRNRNSESDQINKNREKNNRERRRKKSVFGLRNVALAHFERIVGYFNFLRSAPLTHIKHFSRKRA